MLQERAEGGHLPEGEQGAIANPGPGRGGPNQEPRILPFVGEYVVESPVVAVLTRFGLRRPWHLMQTYLAYR